MAMERGTPETPTFGRVTQLRRVTGRSGQDFYQFCFEGTADLKLVPVFSVRNPDHHKDIAKAIVSKKPVIFMAGGVIGAGVQVGRGEPEGRLFWTDLKPGRDEFAKVPIFCENEMQLGLIDWRQVHPDYRFLEDGKKRRDIFGQLPLHVIYPYNHKDKILDRETFVTSPEDMIKAKEHPQVRANVDTISLYFQRDFDWVRIAHWANAYDPTRVFGITSNNEHRQPGTFTWAEWESRTLERSAQGKKLWELNTAAVVTDEVAEGIGVGSSQSQIRIPLVGEEPFLILVRHGPVSPRAVEKQTGFKVVVPTDENGVWAVKFAERNRPKTVDLDYLVNMQAERTNQGIAQRPRGGLLKRIAG